MEGIKAVAVTALTMVLIDAVWLTVVAPKFYQSHIGHLLSSSPNLLAAALFYVIYIIGLVYFVVWPGLNGSQSVGEVIFRGCLFGLVAYSTYDLTNQATMKDWPIIVTVVDMIWGTFLTGATSVIAVIILKKLT